MNGFRLSPQQRHVFNVDGDDWADRSRVQVIFRLTGDLDRGRFEAALDSLVSRYEILRTTFPPVPGLAMPLQVPGARVAPVVTWLDGSSAEQIDELAREALATPMSVDGDLFRIQVHGVSGGEHLVVWTQSALTADVESIATLAGELLDLCAGQEEVSEDVLQYADLADWQNEILEGEDAAEGIAHWRDRRDLASTAKLSFERGPTDGSRRFDSVTVELPTSTREALVDLAESQGVSSTVLMHALWAMVLARFADVDTMVVAGLFDGRSYEGLETAVGPFARYLPVPLDVSETDTFVDVLSRLDRRYAEATEWQEYFAWEHQGSSEHPVSYGFSYLRPHPPRAAGGLRLTYEAADSSTEPHSLELSCSELRGGLSLAIRFDVERFNRAEVERLIESLVALGESASQQPMALVAELSMSGRGARAQLEAESTRLDEPPADRLIIDSIARQAGAHADRPAVVCGADESNYAELWTRVERLAARLQAEGVGPGDVVAVCCERSVELVVALLGVLQSGAAYLPLDPAHPDDRLDFMLKDTGARIVLCHARTASRLESLSAVAVSIDGATDEPFTGARASRGDLAYVIYTSGSTGLPKGVAVTHSNLLHSTTARAHFYSEPPERFLLLSSYSFDSSIVGLFWTLSTGGTLIVPEEGTQQDIGLLADLIERHGVTHTLCLPSLYRLFLEQAPIESLRSLRVVIVAGEACTSALARLHFERRGECTLVNEYGPTEATVWAIAAQLEPDSVEPSVPLGEPVPYVRAYLLDAAGYPVPWGAVGEIYLGGAGVAGGYLGRPALTADRFHPDPFGPVGGRLYRTGDRGRRRSDGGLEFLGRLDHQVKLRGYRIEPGEIEARLDEHPSIRQSVVVPMPTPSGEQRLVAYLVAVDDARLPSHTELREQLQARMPDYMIPSVFVTLDQMPMTTTGKVDRGALIAPEEGRPDLAVEYQAAEGVLETYLVERWEKVLETDPVGVHDNFFELGGNSIQAAVLMNRIRGEIDDFVHVGKLFEHPTIRELATYLEREHSEAIKGLSGGIGSGPSTIEARSPGALEDSIAEMSDEEVESMLEEIHAEGEGGR